MRTEAVQTDLRRERLLRVLSAATFAIFFQAYMVAPLLPRFAAYFGVAVERMGLIVPAYLFPYGFATLFYGLLSDRMGRRPILLGSLAAFVLLTALTATARSEAQLIAWRLATGLGASGVVPLALALVGDLYPYAERGRPLGWLFGAMAGGAAFGSTVGVMLEPFVGWRALFLLVSAVAAILLVAAFPLAGAFPERPRGERISARQVLAGYGSLLANPRGARTYLYVLLNGTFHSGVFTWLGVYFARRYALSEVGIGLAILGYGIPGFLLGPVIGRLADRYGRRRLVPLGLAIGGIAAALLVPQTPLVAAALSVTVLSLGYDATQPLLAGIVTGLGGKRGGQAMGLNVFALFTSFGLGSLLFGKLLPLGFEVALGAFALVQLASAVVAIPLFRTETAPTP